MKTFGRCVLLVPKVFEHRKETKRAFFGQMIGKVDKEKREERERGCAKGRIRRNLQKTVYKWVVLC